MAPVESMRGNISGCQQLTYNEAKAYSIQVGDSISADGYQARIIAKMLHAPYANRKKYFQVRTRSTVNMTATYKHNLALMGGCGALFASLISDKTTAIYNACANACPKDKTLRAFIIPLLRAGLDNKAATISIADGIAIVNPWISSATPNVPVSSTIVDKFASELSN